MASLYICLLIVCVIVICESLPIDRTEVDKVSKTNAFNKVFDGFVGETEHKIVRRSKRSGIISGHLCPSGTGKLYGTDDCVPCDGYVHITIFALYDLG